MLKSSETNIVKEKLKKSTFRFKKKNMFTKKTKRQIRPHIYTSVAAIVVHAGTL